MSNKNIPPSPIDPTENVSLVRKISAEQLIGDWKKQFKIDIRSELSGVDQILLYEGCKSGLQFFYPDEIAGSDKLYENLQKFDWFYMPDRWEHEVALRHLAKCENVLEVGCAQGAFVRTALSAGINIRGIEINTAAVKIAQKERLPVDSIDLLDLLDSGKDDFDAVCTFQVLEHIPQPGAFIESILRILKPGGMLLLAVPNAGSFLQHQYNLLDMPPHHMTKWSKKTFEMLTKIFPLQLEAVQTEPLAAYHVNGFLSAYCNFFKKESKVGRFILNSSTLPLFNKMLSSSGMLRRYFTGQCIFVKLRKI